MIAIELGAARVDEALRAVRALGAHRYVAGRLHLIHAFAFAALGDDAPDVLAGGLAWARALLAGASASDGTSPAPPERGQTSDGTSPALPERGQTLMDVSSRDERLWRRSSDAELVAVLESFWTPAPRSRAARGALRAILDRHGIASPDHAPFDERAEDTIHPIAVDAGWELLGLSQLDPERHKGAIAAFGDGLAFESACFEEDAAIPPAVHLYELPAIGPVELLRGVDDGGALSEPLVVWTQGDPIYLDYVLRGVRRAAKLGACAS